MSNISSLVDEFVTKIRRRQVEGALISARKTVELLRQVASHTQGVSANHASPAEQVAPLLESVRAVGQKLTAANPAELTIGNAVRRVLHIIREEQASLEAAAPSSAAPGTAAPIERAESATSSATNASPSSDVGRAQGGHGTDESRGEGESEGFGSGQDTDQLKDNVIDGVIELLGELDNFHTQIQDQAQEHIHQNEMVLTLGRSRTVFNFLKEAKRKRLFQAVVAEGAPRCEGHVLAKELASAGISTTVITDAAIFAMMARMHTVVIAAHAVMANGGAVAAVGSHLVALAAKRHAVPVIVLAGMFQLCPVHPHSPQDVLRDFRSSAENLDFSDFSECLDGPGALDLEEEDEEGETVEGSSRVNVANPTYDYIPPELISVFVTDTGGHSPSYIYRLMTEYYSPEDYHL
eukprot:TRINITY_DN4027_c0_g1_i1.p1 TRINITY_DN4027_c0_g1~~TRINITY_DN4027_c0_g1_i1.p1  ORF type:complete len:408 (+),score=66.75 TRINITY_DN4027_c0_g1_i1:495-1718(+)